MFLCFVYTAREANGARGSSICSDYCYRSSFRMFLWEHMVPHFLCCEVIDRAKRISAIFFLMFHVNLSDQDHFDKYYDVVMPHLMHILTNATNKTHRMLLAKSADCISMVGFSAGKDKFSKDAQVVMSYATFLISK